MMGKRTWIAAAALGATALLGTAAHAGTSLSVQIGTPYYYQPAPVYYQSAPVYYYQPGYTVQSYGRIAYQGQRRVDRDRDGIPDRRDRDLDNDGRPNHRDWDRDGDGVPNRYDRRPDNRYRY